MFKTIEAVMNPDGQIKLKEPFEVDTPRRALVTFLDGEPHSKSSTPLRKLKLNWRGGLKELKNKYDSVQFQHEILKEWDKNVSR